MTYKVYAEHYYNDYHRSDHVLTFANLENEFYRWMDEHYGGGCGAIPRSADRENPRMAKYWPGRIDLGTMNDVGVWWVHQINSPRGIEFTDGTRTNGKRHASQRVMSVLDSFVREKENPELLFVE